MFDPKCHDLAEVFLSDFTMSDDERAEQIRRLAQKVQDTIEGWIEQFEEDRKFDRNLRRFTPRP